MGSLWQDVRFAVRSLRRTPAFPLAASLTLALGIGATTAIFSTLNAVLLKPLPYPHAEDLYNIRTMLTDGRVTTGLLSNGEVSRVNAAHGDIVAAAGVSPVELTLLRDDGTPEHVTVYGVTESFFDLFGLPMTLGGFTHGNFILPPPPPPNTPPTPGAPPVVVISDRVWHDLYHADRGVVGKGIHFAEFTTTIAGVAPKEFDTPHNGDFWLSQQLSPDDINHFFDGYMRLQPGTPLARANAQMAPIIAGLGRDFPAADHNRAFVTSPLVASVVGDLGPILVIVMSATGLLLLLACVNVTNLLLARGAARAREMAVRVALGAGRGRIVRQLLTESVILASTGAVFGVAVAYAGVRGLLALGAAKLPRLDAVAFDGRVFGFAAIALVVSGLLVGFAPALRLAATDVRTLMSEGSRSTSGGRGTGRWLSAMTVAEIALAIMLVAGAGWLVRGFATLRETNLGFVPNQRIIFDVAFRGSKYRTPDAVRNALQDLLDRVQTHQGVTAVGATASFPLRNALESSLILQLHGSVVDPSMGTRQRIVSPNYFASMGTKLIAGRDFGPGDRATTTPVAIVNKTFARKYLAGRNPLGMQFSAGYPLPDPKNEVTIIGVVDDVRQKSVTDAPEPAYYSPSTQLTPGRDTIVVATRLQDFAALETAIRDDVRAIDPQIAVEFELASDLVSGTIRRQELGMTLMLIFGGVAILLAAIGIYGVVAYAVSQRRSEMATRLALGASQGSVFWLVMRQGGLLAAGGIGIGLVTAYLSGRIVSSQIYAIRASDPVMLAAAIVVVAAIAMIATMIPAWRACRLSPSGVLRSE